MDKPESISTQLFKEAQEVIPGGVNSPVRAFKEIGIDPPFMSRGEGSRIYDEDDNEYIDYVCSWGPLILGHGRKEVKDALKEQIERALSFGAPTGLEVDIAKLMVNLVSSIDMVRLVNSGTEATMSAIRLARGYTGRDKIVKFAGNYHGHSDSLLVKAGSGAMTHGIPGSLGVPEDMVKHTIIASYNDIEGLRDIFAKLGNEIAGVIMEPVSGNMGVVPSSTAFMEEVRRLTREHGALMIMDEVMTGFRLALGGAQSLYGVNPDLTCFGKIVGGGLPAGAYGGKRSIMEKVSPLGGVYQAGTLSGNPLAVTAGITTLRILRDNPEIYKELEEKAARLEEGFAQNIRTSGIGATINRVGSMMTLFFASSIVIDYESAKKCNLDMYSRYYRSMLQEGIYLPPSQFEAFFVSAAHSWEDIERTIVANKRALLGMA